jgi:hypothetical protein
MVSDPSLVRPAVYQNSTFTSARCGFVRRDPLPQMGNLPTRGDAELIRYLQHGRDTASPAMDVSRPDAAGARPAECQQRELQDRLEAINKEYAAVDAYERAKSGKPVAALVRTVRGSIFARIGL